MKISFCSIAFQKNKWGNQITIDKDIMAIIPYLADIGYHGVEIWGHHLLGKTDEDIKKISALSVKLGLSIPMISPYLNFTGSAESGVMKLTFKDSLALGKKFIHYASLLGCPKIRCFTGQVGSANATEEQWQACVKGLNELTGIAEDKGIIFALETHTHNLSDNPAAIKRIIKEVNSSSLKVIYQPLTFKHDPIGVYDELKDFITHMHLNNTAEGSSKLSYLDNGVINYNQFIDHIKGHGYQGYLSLEYCCWPVPDDLVKHELTYLKTKI